MAVDPHQAHEHGHDHAHDHGAPELEEAADTPIDPGRRRRWRLAVALGAWLAVLGWIAWPTWHLLEAWRPLRRFEGAPATFGLALTLAVAGWLVTTTPEPRPAGPHRVGQWFVRALLILGAVLGGASFAIGWDGPGAALVDWLAFPVVLLTTPLGFAYVGRLHRLAGRSRLANLADLAGLVLPLLWIASQTLGGYPGPMVWGPALLGMIVGGVALGGLGVVYLLPEPPAPESPVDAPDPETA